LSCNTNAEKNDVGLILYEYDVYIKEIDSIIERVNKIAPLAKYKSSDSCLLIINRFETLDTYKNFAIPPVKDSSQINKKCYRNQYPLPNFIEYYRPNKNSDLKLDNTFLIYVLEAGSGKYSEKYNLLPSPQMPDNWKNGYSKGIAISEQNKTIIYWSVIW
jgi:hypothetical protein